MPSLVASRLSLWIAERRQAEVYMTERLGESRTIINRHAQSLVSDSRYDH